MVPAGFFAAMVAVVALVVPSPPVDRVTTPPPPPGAAVAPYRSSIGTVTAAGLGPSWRPGCPVGPADLRRVTVDYWGFDGRVHTGDLIVHRTVAADMAVTFGKLYANRFPIRRIHPVSVFGADDGTSMRANNTSAFNCRPVAGTAKWSEHASGTAVDLNPIMNPWVTSRGTVDPSEGRRFADRTRIQPGMIRSGGAVTKAFADVGWTWGGSWATSKDYQHFSRSGR